MPSPESQWQLLERMLLMRRFEETVQSLAEERAFAGHYHLYIGQEATGAGAIALLRAGDHIATTHRNHGHLIARGADPGAALAEILGRQGGLNRGYGGTFHLTAPELGFLSTSGIVGGAISLAIGGGYAAKQRHDGSVSVAFFGDGALEEGISFEAMNIAALWHLPVIFICENNDAAAWGETRAPSPEISHAAVTLHSIPMALGIEAARIDGSDTSAVTEAVAAAIARCRDGGGPVFIEAMTRQWPGNSQQFPSLATGITDLRMATGEVATERTHRHWYEEGDPVLQLGRKLVAGSADGASRLSEIDGKVRQQMAAALAFALASPLPPPAAALDHVFA